MLAFADFGLTAGQKVVLEGSPTRQGCTRQGCKVIAASVLPQALT
jgi:hypothetical protein